MIPGSSKTAKEWKAGWDVPADGGTRVGAVVSTFGDYSNHSTTKKLQNISCYESWSCYPVGLGSVFICLLSEDPGNFSHLENSS